MLSREERLDRELIVDDGEPGADSVRGGVSMSPASALTLISAALVCDSLESGASEVARTRLASDCELSEEAEDSSNVRFGDR